MTHPTPNLSNLSHPNANVRSQTALALGQSGDPNVIAPLIDLLCHEPDLAVREDVTWGLVKFGEKAVEPLTQRLFDKSSAVRHHVTHALGKIGSRSALQDLLSILNDPVEDVRVKVVVVIGQIDPASVADVLLPRFADESDRVRNTLMDTLAPIATDIVDAALNGLNHEAALVRENCAALLGLAQDAQAVDALYDLCHDVDLEVQLAAVQALGDIGSSASISHLEQLRNSDNRIVRTMASALLKRRNKPQR